MYNIILVNHNALIPKKFRVKRYPTDKSNDTKTNTILLVYPLESASEFHYPKPSNNLCGFL